MNIVTVAAGPLIGSVIGYVTNYIAVKMLFRPLQPIKIGKWTLPFTPGIFPKRKEKLAKALGLAVGNNLLTGEDLEKFFLTDNIKQSIIMEIQSSLLGNAKDTIKNRLSIYLEQQDYQYLRKQLENMICQLITSGLSKIDIRTLVAQEARRIIKEKIQGTLLGKMVNDNLITALTTPIGEKVETYFNENSKDIVTTMVTEEIEALENKPLGNMRQKYHIKEELILEIAERIYTTFIQKKIKGLLSQFDIAGVVEQKVNDMDVLEIEKLVLAVINNELKAIVNLGALIGFIIGLLNIFVFLK